MAVYTEVTDDAYWRCAATLARYAFSASASFFSNQTLKDICRVCCSTGPIWDLPIW
jgi:hypothetical protein